MAVHGKTGVVLVGSTTICATEWTIDRTMEEVDVTTFCDGTGDYRSYIGGFKDATGSFTMLTCDSDYFGSSGSVSLGNSIVTFGGSVIFTGESANNSVDARYEDTYTFRFTGEVTKSCAT